MIDPKNSDNMAVSLRIAVNKKNSYKNNYIIEPSVSTELRFSREIYPGFDNDQQDSTSIIKTTLKITTNSSTI